MPSRPDPKPARRARLMLALTTLAPLVVFAAMFGTQSGWWDWPVGYSLLTMTVGWWMAVGGALVALLAVVFALKDLKRAGVFALLAVVVAGGTLGLFVQHRMKLAEGGDVWDATTAPADPPGFSADTMADRRGAAPLAQPQACEGVASVPTQVALQQAVPALNAAGFRPSGATTFTAEGERKGMFFGFTHDAVIRIRPGATDIRVTARTARPDGGEACRLMREIHEALESYR